MQRGQSGSYGRFEGKFDAISIVFVVIGLELTVPGIAIGADPGLWLELGWGLAASTN